MQINVQGFGFALTAPLLDHTERRLRFALTRTRDRIKRVVVRLGNTHGTRGGEDKFCRMQVFLNHASPVLIEDVGTDLYAVIDRVAERVGRNVVKRVDRMHEDVRVAKLNPRRSLPGDVPDMSQSDGV